MRPSLAGIVLLGLTLAACGSSSLTGSTGGRGGTGGSPGTVTFVLTTMSDGAFCDQLTCGGGNQHLTITTPSGDVLNWPGGVGCGTDCSTCRQLACPELAIACPAPEGVVYKGGTVTWDGSFNATSTCGAANTSCLAPKYAAPGSYVARFCATVGTVTQPDGGLPVCNTNGFQQCTETTFDFPGAGTVQLEVFVPEPQSP